jgi:DNA polymerase III epsilon subunit family exonuclease
MKIIIFDTETTGLLLPDNSPLEVQPKIIEFYGVAINEEFEILSEVDTFIYPGEPISPEITKITGIKDSDVKYARDFGMVAQSIVELFKDADLAVAHNIAFDNGMLHNEFKRLNMEKPKARYDLCTVDVCKIEYGYRISLGALYNKIFKKAFKAHRAKNDVMALVRVFHDLTERGVIDLDFYKN